MFSCLRRSSKKQNLTGSKYSAACNTWQWQCSTEAAGNGLQCYSLIVPGSGAPVVVGNVCMDLLDGNVVLSYTSTDGWFFTNVSAWAGMSTDQPPADFPIAANTAGTTASLQVPVSQLQACPAAQGVAVPAEELAALSTVAVVLARATVVLDPTTNNLCPNANNTVSVNVQVAANLNLNCCCQPGAQGDCPCKDTDVVGVDCPCIQTNVPGPLACPCIPPYEPDVTCPCTPGPTGNCPCTGGRVPGVDCPCTPGPQGNCPCEEQQQPGTDCPCPSNNPACTTPNHPTGCNTAFAKDGTASTCFLNTPYGFTRWGWSNGPFAKGSSGTMTLYAGAAQCNTAKGYNAGTLFWAYGTDGKFTAKYVDSTGYGMSAAQIYVGTAPFATSNGAYTVSPGQFGNIQTAPTGTYMMGTTFDIDVAGAPDTIYIVAHANSCSL